VIPSVSNLKSADFTETLDDIQKTDYQVSAGLEIINRLNALGIPLGDLKSGYRR
ncbi:uncharacterized protein METZ01_LOCUS207589, partial [marine metagenome]